ncbi:MAG: 1-deoxy-D-xylulose-5-phosphate synthase N-terminal domain-containing protein, partial [Planctomycetota bacterium]|nr:1-deoxy-D-xylulose-5-phosphate synthase N-terminal domain-containing protein [Planctomycetota bacterium]
MSSLLLSEIRSPDELQGRSLEDLESLCNQMRAALVEKVLQTGGHLGSNLGVVELTVALHSSFDFLRDKLVFDVSHQCYPHKMLTGRYAEFDGLRQTEGISGFTNRFESDFDPLTAGHAGTAISFQFGGHVKHHHRHHHVGEHIFLGADRNGSPAVGAPRPTSAAPQ